jgi:hypothetical protein
MQSRGSSGVTGPDSRSPRSQRRRAVYQGPPDGEALDPGIGAEVAGAGDDGIVVGVALGVAVIGMLADADGIGTPGAVAPDGAHSRPSVFPDASV